MGSRLAGESDWSTEATAVKAVVYDTNVPINVHPTSVSVTEGGATDTYDVCLATAVAPGSMVTVTPAPDSQLHVAPMSVVFDPLTNWALPLTVTVSAVDDNIVEGTHAGTITHTVREHGCHLRFNCQCVLD